MIKTVFSKKSSFGPWLCYLGFLTSLTMAGVIVAKPQTQELKPAAQQALNFDLTPGFRLDLQHVVIELQDRLQKTAMNFASMLHVPYIWGGDKIGSVDECLACRSCVLRKNVPLKSRLGACSACRSCGMDCSHFVNRVYKDSGLEYPYASTAELKRVDTRTLVAAYGMVDIGNRLALAQAGDLLVYREHVVMLLKARTPTHGDVIHVSRFRDHDRRGLGGFRIDRNINLKNFRGGRLLRIMRHKNFFSDPKVFS